MITRDTSGDVKSTIMSELDAGKAKREEAEIEKARRGFVEAANEFRLENVRNKLLDEAARMAEKSVRNGPRDVTDAVVAGSLEEAVRGLGDLDSETGGQKEVGKVFVIGGAEIYASALRLSTKGLGRGMRVVMTKILRRRKDGEEQEQGQGQGQGQLQDSK